MSYSRSHRVAPRRSSLALVAVTAFAMGLPGCAEIVAGHIERRGENQRWQKIRALSQHSQPAEELCDGAAESNGRVLEALTPEQVRAALADEKAVGCYPVKGGAGSCFTTPYSRVAARGAAATGPQRSASEADVPPEIVAPRELHVHVFRRHRTDSANLVAAFLVPAERHDRGPAIEPVETLTPASWVAAEKGAWSFDRTLVFPLCVLRKDLELQLFFDIPVACDFFLKHQCTGRFSLAGVR